MPASGQLPSIAISGGVAAASRRKRKSLEPHSLLGIGPDDARLRSSAAYNPAKFQAGSGMKLKSRSNVV